MLQVGGKERNTNLTGTVNSIYFTTGGKPLSIQERETLQAIACQLQLEGGPGVLQARIILGIDLDDGMCEGQRFAQPHKNAAGKPVSIHPNPATNKINMHIGAGEIMSSAIIYDIAGKQIEINEIKRSNNGNVTFDISKLSNGIYTLSIITSSAHLIGKFVKE